MEIADSVPDDDFNLKEKHTCNFYSTKKGARKGATWMNESRFVDEDKAEQNSQLLDKNEN